MDNSTTGEFEQYEVHRPFANALWTSTGVLGCMLNLTLFIIVLLNTLKGFYRTLTLVVACVDFCCALSGMLLGVWYYKIENGLFCYSFGVSITFPYWLDYSIFIVWLLTVYGEVIVITYCFVWRAVLISNSRHVRLFEHTTVFIMLAIFSCIFAYCDHSIDCTKEYVNLSALEIMQVLLPATLTALCFLVIIVCALLIVNTIRRGTLSKKMRKTHTKQLVILSAQAVNPLFTNFLSNLIYQLGLIAHVPAVLVGFIPFSSLHPALNALIILVLTSDHRKYVLKIFRSTSSSVVLVTPAST